MIRNICKILFFGLITINQSFAELTCSRNGTTVLYINGINTSRGANKDTASKINDIVRGMSGSIDKKSVSTVIGIHNYSGGILSDIAETKAQVAINHFGEKRQEYWKKMALAEVSFPATQRIDLQKKISEAFDQLYKTEPRVDPATGAVDQDYFTELDFYNSLRKYEPIVASIYARAYSDNATVEELKNKILKYYDKGKGKVIVVAHSQGNEVLYSAIARINTQAVPAYLNIPDSLTQWSEVNNHWFNSVIGYVQLAPPSPRLVSPPATASYPSNLPKINHSRYMRLNIDKIINNSYLVNSIEAVPANLEYDLNNSITKLSESTMTIMEILEKMNVVSTAGYHSVDNVYLSKNFVAKNETGTSQSMLKHFEDAIAEVGEELESNCAITVPPPTRALCQVWSRGFPDIEFFAYEDHLRGVEFNLPNPIENTYKFVGSSCGRVDTANGAPVSSQGLWCLGVNNRVVIQSIGEDTIVNYPYTSPCYEGRVFGQTGVVPL